MGDNFIRNRVDTACRRYVQITDTGRLSEAKLRIALEELNIEGIRVIEIRRIDLDHSTALIEFLEARCADRMNLLQMKTMCIEGYILTIHEPIITWWPDLLNAFEKNTIHIFEIDQEYLDSVTLEKIFKSDRLCCKTTCSRNLVVCLDKHRNEAIIRFESEEVANTVLNHHLGNEFVTYGGTRICKIQQHHVRDFPHSQSMPNLSPISSANVVSEPAPTTPVGPINFSNRENPPFPQTNKQGLAENSEVPHKIPPTDHENQPSHLEKRQAPAGVLPDPYENPLVRAEIPPDDPESGGVHYADPSAPVNMPPFTPNCTSPPMECIQYNNPCSRAPPMKREDFIKFITPSTGAIVTTCETPEDCDYTEFNPINMAGPGNANTERKIEVCYTTTSTSQMWTDVMTNSHGQKTERITQVTQSQTEKVVKVSAREAVANAQRPTDTAGGRTELDEPGQRRQDVGAARASDGAETHFKQVQLSGTLQNVSVTRMGDGTVAGNPVDEANNVLGNFKDIGQSNRRNSDGDQYGRRRSNGRHIRFNAETSDHRRSCPYESSPTQYEPVDSPNDNSDPRQPDEISGIARDSGEGGSNVSTNHGATMLTPYTGHPVQEQGDVLLPASVLSLQSNSSENPSLN